METENYPSNEFSDPVNKSKENICGAVNHSGDGHMVNGISNGFGEKLKKDENRDKHKEKHKDHKDKHRDKDKYKDREHKHSSSGEHRNKEKHSSSSGKERERHKEKEKERDGHKDKESKHRDEKREKEHKSSSSSHKDKEKDYKEKREEKTSNSPSKHNSSIVKASHSSSKDKEKHNSSSSNKDRSEKDKHRSEKEKSRHSSEKSKHSSSREKEKREKDREKERREEKVKHEHESKDKVKRQILLDEDEEVPIPEVKQEPIFSDLDDSKRDADDSYGEGELTIEEETYVKTEEGSENDEDLPLLERSSSKREASDDEDDVPLMARKKVKKEKQKKRKFDEEEEEEEDFKPAKKKPVNKKPKVKQEQQFSHDESPRKKKKPEDEHEVWKWWEEEKKPDGVKWTYLEHKGPVFAPDYEPLPPNVKFFYDGEEMKLSEEAEEVATFYARMLDHDYTTKDAFNKNFFKDWRKCMTSKEKEKISDLKKCNFKQMHAYFQQKSEERKAMTKEEKKAIKEKNDEMVEEYGFCTIDGHKERIGNFKIEPPGLFRGRGEHPKMGMLKRRVMPEDVSINCSQDSNIPQPPPGHKWKDVRHDNTVTWLASWTENVQGQVKYVMLNPSSKLKGEKDMQKYETARKLAKSIDKIRREYREDWKSKEMRIRQRAVALYFIDILALRAGNEKDEDQADTVGCCSLRVEHITLHPEKDGKEYVVTFDFLGKDSIRYYNEVPVEKRVFKNLQLFMEGKKGADDLFDRLNTTILNKHLNELMEGLTAKVFRTYNASWTLQQQLKELTDPNYTIPEMVLAYNRANRAVAILCNHQRSIPKSHQKSMDNLKGKISAKKEAVDEAEKQYKYAKKEAKNGSAKERINADKLKKKVERLREQLNRLEVQETDREENKTIALGTSKLNYLDPRISVAWCKKYNVPIEKVYNKTQRQKFRWAIDMAGADYVF